jgi:hypothetical protein
MIPAIDYGQSKNIGGFSLDQQATARIDSVAVDAQRSGWPVPLSRLDSLTFPKTPALIKIDVEGLELQVLQGATQFLEAHAYPPLLLEAWNLDWFKDRREQLLSYLTHLGYEFFIIIDEIIAQHPKFPRQIKFEGDMTTTGIQMRRVR